MIEYVKNYFGHPVVPIYSSDLFGWFGKKAAINGTIELSTLSGNDMTFSGLPETIRIRSKKTNSIIAFHLVHKHYSSEKEFLYADYESSFCDASLKVRIFND